MSPGRLLFSTGHGFSKLALLAGIVLAAHGAHALKARRDEAGRRDRLYEQIVAGVAARDDGRVIDRSIAFLEDGADARGPRFEQVASFLDRATLRYVVSRKRAGDRKGAEAALGRYNAVSKNLSL